MCASEVGDLDIVRARLTRLEKLPPEKAKHFLNGGSGDAWPVPDEDGDGNFVLALHPGKYFCTAYARRADTKAVKTLFHAIVANPPAPIISRQIRHDHEQTLANGAPETIVYEWSFAKKSQRMHFMLTVAPSKTAELQAMASANMVKKMRDALIIELRI